MVDRLVNRSRRMGDGRALTTATGGRFGEKTAGRENRERAEAEGAFGGATSSRAIERFDRRAAGRFASEPERTLSEIVLRTSSALILESATAMVETLERVNVCGSIGERGMKRR